MKHFSVDIIKPNRLTGVSQSFQRVLRHCQFPRFGLYTASDKA